MSRGDESTERSLRDLRAPDEAEASRRAWGAVADAFDERAPVRRRRRVLPVTAVATAVLVGSAALTPPGRAIAQWARKVVTPSRSATPDPVALGVAGRLLVSRSDGLAILRPDGSGRSLGVYSEGTWSPHCKYVAATVGRTISAIDPETAEVRWTRTQPGVVSSPRWAPSGFRVAYLTRHRELWVVRGDGVSNRPLVIPVADVSPAWRPGGAANVIAYATTRRQVETVDVDSGRRLARISVQRSIRSLHWTYDGRDLVIADDAGVLAVAVDTGRRVRVRRLAGPPAALSISPTRREAALLASTSSRPIVIPIDRPERLRALESTIGVTDLHFTPDGTQVLLASAAGDSWQKASAGGRLVSPRFEAVSTRPVTGGGVEPSFPRVRGWCADARP